MFNLQVLGTAGPAYLPPVNGSLGWHNRTTYTYTDNGTTTYTVNGTVTDNGQLMDETHGLNFGTGPVSHMPQSFHTISLVTNAIS